MAHSAACRERIGACMVEDDLGRARLEKHERRRDARPADDSAVGQDSAAGAQPVVRPPDNSARPPAAKRARQVAFEDTAARPRIEQARRTKRTATEEAEGQEDIDRMIREPDRHVEDLAGTRPTHDPGAATT